VPVGLASVPRFRVASLRIGTTDQRLHPAGGTDAVFRCKRLNCTKLCGILGTQTHGRLTPSSASKRPASTVKRCPTFHWPSAIAVSSNSQFRSFAADAFRGSSMGSTGVARSGQEYGDQIDGRSGLCTSVTLPTDCPAVPVHWSATSPTGSSRENPCRAKRANGE